MKVSALTLVRHRREHLVNLMLSLNAQRYRPDELVIAWMQPEPEKDLPATCFPVRHVIVSGQSLPLAKARNAAVNAATFDALVFLDVDCIASPSLIERYRHVLSDRAALYIGEVHYLPADAVRYTSSGKLDFERLGTLGKQHPARPGIEAHEVRFEPDHGNLWGLSFALMKQDHFRAGGMDEGYIGYGGEETDYAWRLANADVPLYWVGNALAWHQHHPLHSPPWPHFDAIITNAQRFYQRWEHWCMDYWLNQFCEAGAIDWSPNADHLTVLRRPTPQEVAAARLPDSACYC